MMASVNGNTTVQSDKMSTSQFKKIIEKFKTQIEKDGKCDLYRSYQFLQDITEYSHYMKTHKSKFLYTEALHVLSNNLPDKFCVQYYSTILNLVLDEIVDLRAKRDMLLFLSTVIQKVSHQEKNLILREMNQFLLFRLVDFISSHGNYDLQAVTIEILFTIFGAKELQKKNEEASLFPASAELCKLFLNINVSNFEEDSRTFLNALNKDNNNVLSLNVESIALDHINFQKPSDSKYFWFDINIYNNKGDLSWYCEKNTLNNNATESEWELITVYSTDIKQVWIERMKEKTIVVFDIHGSCLANTKQIQSQLEGKKYLKITFKDPLIIHKLKRILGKIFKTEYINNVHSNVYTKPMYRPLYKLSGYSTVNIDKSIGLESDINILEDSNHNLSMESDIFLKNKNIEINKNSEIISIPDSSSAPSDLLYTSLSNDLSIEYSSTSEYETANLLEESKIRNSKKCPKPLKIRIAKPKSNLLDSSASRTHNLNIEDEIDEYISEISHNASASKDNQKYDSIFIVNDIPLLTEDLSSEGNKLKQNVTPSQFTEDLNNTKNNSQKSLKTKRKISISAIIPQNTKNTSISEQSVRIINNEEKILINKNEKPQISVNSEKQELQVDILENIETQQKSNLLPNSTSRILNLNIEDEIDEYISELSNNASAYKYKKDDSIFIVNDIPLLTEDLSNEDNKLKQDVTLPQFTEDVNITKNNSQKSLKKKKKTSIPSIIHQNTKNSILDKQFSEQNLRIINNKDEIIKSSNKKEKPQISVKSIARIPLIKPNNEESKQGDILENIETQHQIPDSSFQLDPIVCYGNNEADQHSVRSNSSKTTKENKLSPILSKKIEFNYRKETHKKIFQGPELKIVVERLNLKVATNINKVATENFNIESRDSDNTTNSLSKSKSSIQEYHSKSSNEIPLNNIRTRSKPRKNYKNMLSGNLKETENNFLNKQTQFTSKLRTSNELEVKEKNEIFDNVNQFKYDENVKLICKDTLDDILNTITNKKSTKLEIDGQLNGNEKSIELRKSNEHSGIKKQLKEYTSRKYSKKNEDKKMKQSNYDTRLKETYHEGNHSNSDDNIPLKTLRVLMEQQEPKSKINILQNVIIKTPRSTPIPDNFEKNSQDTNNVNQPSISTYDSPRKPPVDDTLKDTQDTFDKIRDFDNNSQFSITNTNVAKEGIEKCIEIENLKIDSKENKSTNLLSKLKSSIQEYNSNSSNKSSLNNIRTRPKQRKNYKKMLSGNFYKESEDNFSSDNMLLNKQPQLTSRLHPSDDLREKFDENVDEKLMETATSDKILKLEIDNHNNIHLLKKSLKESRSRKYNKKSEDKEIEQSNYDGKENCNNLDADIPLRASKKRMIIEKQELKTNVSQENIVEETLNNPEQVRITYGSPREPVDTQKDTQDTFDKIREMKVNNHCQLSTTNTSVARSKRKLYNPDETSYLDAIEKSVRQEELGEQIARMKKNVTIKEVSEPGQSLLEEACSMQPLLEEEFRKNLYDNVKLTKRRTIKSISDVRKKGSNKQQREKKNKYKNKENKMQENVFVKDSMLTFDNLVDSLFEDFGKQSTLTIHETNKKVNTRKRKRVLEEENCTALKKIKIERKGLADASSGHSGIYTNLLDFIVTVITGSTPLVQANEMRNLTGLANIVKSYKEK